MTPGRSGPSISPTGWGQEKVWPIVMVTPPTWLETTETTNETVGAVGAPLGASLEDGNQAGVGSVRVGGG